MVLRMENRIEAVRHFKSPYAPSVNFMGARLRSDDRRLIKEPVYVAGKGLSLSQALQSLCGEAAERDGLFMRDGDDTRSILDANLAVSGVVPAGQVLEQGEADDLGSTGCASHNVFEAAIINAIYELLERRAVGLWWSGERPPQRLDEDWPGFTEILTYTDRLRSGAFVSRRTSFFRLQQFGPVHTVLARSGALDGSQTAIAFAASGSLAKAAQRAFLELLSVELETADLMAAKLNGDFIDRQSNRGLVADRQEALVGSKAHLFDAKALKPPTDQEVSSSATALIKHLLSDGYEIVIADLTRPDINLPTCRAMFADAALQPRFPGGFDLSPL